MQSRRDPADDVSVCRGSGPAGQGRGADSAGGPTAYGWTFVLDRPEDGSFQHLSLTQGIWGARGNLPPADQRAAIPSETPDTGFRSFRRGERCGGSRARPPARPDGPDLNTNVDNFTTLGPDTDSTLATSLISRFLGQMPLY